MDTSSLCEPGPVVKACLTGRMVVVVLDDERWREDQVLFEARRKIVFTEDSRGGSWRMKQDFLVTWPYKTQVP